MEYKYIKKIFNMFCTSTINTNPKIHIFNSYMKYMNIINIYITTT